MTTILSPVEKWQEDFREGPLSALEGLLLRQAYMGNLHRNDTSEILFRLFHNENPDVLRMLDMAMLDWFEKYWMAIPASVSSSRWAYSLSNSFIAVHRLDLNESHDWLLNSYLRGRAWLRSLYSSPARDPEAALLRTFALRQCDQGLIPLWMRLCRMEEDVPLHYASIGLLGLRKLPDKNGVPSGDPQPPVFKGIIDLAEAVYKREGPHGQKEGHDFWDLECRALMALYPRSRQYWERNILPFIERKTNPNAIKWLTRVIPGLSKNINGGAGKKPTKRGFVRLPSWDERNDILELIEKHSIKEIISRLHEFCEKHRAYALHSGNSEDLIKTFTDISNRIYRQDADLALELAEEAFLWAPNNPYTWTTRSKIEAYRRNYKRAKGLLWEAKRKFPENDKVRNQLAYIFKEQSKYEIAEFICYQTMLDFPKDRFCRTELAEVLKAQGNLEKAETIYRKAMEDFPNEVHFHTGLAEVLKAQGNLEEAEDVYRKAMEDFPRNAHCYVGLTGVLLQQGKRDDAIALLEKTVKKFPQNNFAKEFLKKVKGGEVTTENCEEYFEKLNEENAKEKYAELVEKQVIELPSEGTDKEKKVEIVKKTGTENKLPVTFSSNIPDGYLLETKIGEANLYRFVSCMVKGDEKEKYREKAFSSIEGILNETNNKNIPTILEKGWWLVDGNEEVAEGFFSVQLERHPHVLGLHLGNLRFKNLKGEKIELQQWNSLINDFPNRSTAIKLEHALQEMNNGNGTRINTLERLRKQLRKNTKQLPSSIQENEEWSVSTVRQSIFEDIDIDKPLTEDDIPLLLGNCKRHEIRLKGIVEQCLSTI